MAERRFKIHLDPEEVQDHLAELGYQNISPDQLKEFMKDLKRLIKHDLVKKQLVRKSRKEVQTPSSDYTTRSTTPADSVLPSSSSCSTGMSDFVDKSRSSFNPISLHYQRHSSSSLSSSSSHSSQNLTPESSLNSTPEYTVEQEKKHAKPKSKRASEASQPPRHDPVALYHYYQKFWKQFNVPETNQQQLWEVQSQTREAAGDRLCFRF